MMNGNFTALFLGFAALTFATFPASFADSNSKVFDCVARSNDSAAEIIVDSVSNGKMKIITKTASSVCALKLILAEDYTRSVEPYLYYEFEKGDCEPALEKKVETDFVRSIQLKVYTQDKKVVRSTFRWLKSAQPSECQVKLARLFDARINIKKWDDRNLPVRGISGN